MRTITTKCDYCGKNVDNAERCGNFVVVLSCYQRDGVPNMMLVHPPIDGQMHFCSIACLHSWLDNGRKPQNYVQPDSSQFTTSVTVGNDGAITIIGDILK